jgi:hypothetical protein
MGKILNVRFLWLLALAVFGVAAEMESARAADTKRYEVLKGLYFYQDREGQALPTTNFFRFSAQVYATAVGNVNGAIVTTPRVKPFQLLPDSDGDPFRFRDKFKNQFDLENKFPNGTYFLGIDTANDGSRSITLNVAGDAYPAAPVVTSLAGAQQLPFNAYNKISWGAFAGATAADFVQFQIEDLDEKNVWETPDFGETGALNGLATSVVIPAGTLHEGKSYVGMIRFVKVQHTASASYLGVPGLGGYFSRTEFFMRAVSTGLTPAVDRVQVWRMQRSEQLETGAPFLQPKAYEFIASLDALNSNVVRTVSIKPPTSAALALEPNKDFSEFDLSEDLQTNVVNFRSAYAGGVYQVSAAYGRGSLQAGLNLPAAPFPPAPNLLGLESFPGHCADQDLVVAWQPWTTGTDADFIRVEMYDAGDKVFETPSLKSPKRLRATDTTVTIPAAAFTPGHTNRLLVYFYRVGLFDTEVVPGAIAYGGEAARTKFDFVTLAPNVPEFGVTLAQLAWQRNDTLIEPDAARPFSFEAFANPTSEGVLRGAAVSIPNGPTLALATNENDFRFAVSVVENSLAAVASRYPMGAYSFQFDTATDGLRTTSVNLPANALPPLPRVLRLPSLAFVRAGSDYKVSWLPWTGADTNRDSIEFTLQDGFGRLLALGDLGLTAASTNVTILREHNETANRSYIARLRFVQRKSGETAAYPGARGTATLVSETAFYISTLNSSSPFSEGSVALNPARQLQFRVTNPQVGRTYVIYESADLATWRPLQTNRVTGNALIIVVPPTLPMGFFKTVLIP